MRSLANERFPPRHLGNGFVPCDVVAHHCDQIKNDLFCHLQAVIDVFGFFRPVNIDIVISLIAISPKVVKMLAYITKVIISAILE